MSIEKITSKIIAEAEEAAAAVLQQAQDQSDAILAEAHGRAESLLTDAQARGKEEKEKLIARRKAVADIDGRKLILAEKQKLIGDCFDQAIERLASMDSQDYIAFVADLVKKTGQTQGELILSPRDRRTIGKELIDYLSQNLQGCAITLAEETRQIRGGFLLKQGSVYMNGTIESLMDEAREALTGEIAGQLFQ